jgi:hypothetical protein
MYNIFSLEDRMKIFSFCVPALFMLIASGCAQLPTNGVEAKPDYDYVKVAVVERYAQRNGIQVIWVNMPQARDK